VLPMAIDRAVAVAVHPRTDDRIVAYPVKSDTFVRATIAALARAGHSCDGADLVIAGNVPIGAGLSSSAALCVALIRALVPAVAMQEWTPLEIAHLVQAIELDAANVRCGIMDPYVSAAAVAGNAVLLDCRAGEHTVVPIPPEAAIVVMDTGTRRRLAGSAYNDRRAACDEAVRALRTIDASVTALRDVTMELLAEARGLLTDVQLRRARHVVEENARVHAFARALRASDLAAAGALLNASHASLRDLYEVSSAELDLVCEVARDHAGCFGARMTGAGFGGCALALVRREVVEEFIRETTARYAERSEGNGAFFEA
jgi:galactokinase